MEFHAWRVDDFIDGKLSIENGFTSPSDKPGHGITFDFEKLNSYAIK